MSVSAVPPLLPALAAVPDPRRPRGRRHPLPAILALSCAAMLAGCDSLLAIAEWGRDPAGGAPLAARLGFTRARTPCVATLHRVFRRIDAAAFERAVGGWAAAVAAAAGRGRTPVGVAVDGKVLRGSAAAGVPAVHLLAALRQDLGVVLNQVRAPAGHGEAAAVPDLLAGLVLDGAVLTMDAGVGGRDVAAAVLARGGTT